MQFSKQINCTRTQKYRIENEKSGKLDFVKVKNVWSSKDTSKKTKANHRLEENICDIYIRQRNYIQNT